MILFSVRRHLRGSPVAAGATSGQAHARLVAEQLDRLVQPADAGVLIGWDFAGVEVASTSYIRATVLHSLGWGRWHAEALTVREARWLAEAGWKPRDVHVVVLNAEEDVADAINDTFAVQGWPVLLGQGNFPDGHRSGKLAAFEPLESAELLGFIETTAQLTLDAMNGESCTALELHERFAAEVNISATGWNNRLAELFKARLVRRTRNGKTWIYHPLTKHLTYGQRVP